MRETCAGAEPAWGLWTAPLPGRLQRKNRVRRHLRPDPGGLFPGGKKTGEKLSGWLRIGQDSVPSAELSRTSSYTLMPSSTAAPTVCRDSGDARRGTASHYSQ